jgi:ribonuclease P protein component
MAQPRSTWKKAEKLKSRKRIDKVFKEGRNFSVYPFRVFYLLAQAPEKTGLAHDPGKPSADPGKHSPDPGKRTSAVPLQAGFGAASRQFGKAVDRNRIKRLSREAWRLQKQPLAVQLSAKGLSLAVFVIYTGKELPDYRLVSTKIGVALQKLIKEMA